jgi:hypothetical protein
MRQVLRMSGNMEIVMKLAKPLLLFSLLIACMLSSVAWAYPGHHGNFHHTRARVGVFIGVPLGGAYYYPPRYYYPPDYYYSPAPVVVAPASPPVYVEQADQQASAQLEPNYWYYCQNPQGYYPYVKECSTSWQKVAPQPSSKP